MIIDNKDNTYSVKFYASGKAEYVTVDRRIATYQGSIFGAHSKTGWNPNDSKNVVWSALVERAYAQWREGSEGKPGYNLIGNGDSLNRPLEFVTGKSTSNYSGSSLTFSLLQSALASGRAIDLSSHRGIGIVCYLGFDRLEGLLIISPIILGY